MRGHSSASPARKPAKFHPGCRSRRRFTHDDLPILRRHTVRSMRTRLRQQRRRQVQRSGLVGFEDGVHGGEAQANSIQGAG